MSEFVKKAVMGYKEVPGGYPDPECTHVIMEKKEYDQQLREVSAAKQEAWDAKYKADREIQQERREAKEKVDAVESAAAARVAELEKALAEEQKESALQRRLNANLLRIAKERANADRKLKPKKEHTGYAVVSSMEKEHRYRDGDMRWRMVMLWETVLETPYTVDYEVDEVRRLTQELFQEGEDGTWLIQRIGINGNYPNGYAKMIEDKDWRQDHQQYNVMLEQRLKANYRTGYWEITFQHTKPLAAVPADMRAGG